SLHQRAPVHRIAVFDQPDGAGDEFSADPARIAPRHCRARQSGVAGSERIMKGAILHLLFLTLLLSGCATQPSNLTLNSSLQHERFALNFSHAYVLRESAGDYHIVLL